MKSITQKHGRGCAIASSAYVANMSYSRVAHFFCISHAETRGYFCRDLVSALKRMDYEYEYKYVTSSIRKKMYAPFTIVFITRSKRYPSGHYLVRTHDGRWMDSWINFTNNTDIRYAKSGFRMRLPGRPIYALFLKHL